MVRFGRLPTNDFAFDAHADLDASGNHAEIRREGGRYVLVDVGSRNGTLVNGRPVQRHVLEGGEEIEFGTGGPRVRVEIVVSAASGRSAPTAPATPLLAGLDAPVSPQAPTALAPAVVGVAGLGGVPAGEWSPQGAWSPGAPPAHGPSGSTPPSAPPPAGPGSPVPVVPPAAPAPKLYGQKTVDLMIRSALEASRSRGAGGTHDTAVIRQVAGEVAKQKSRTMLLVLALVVVLFLLALCGVSALVAVLWVRTYGI